MRLGMGRRYPERQRLQNREDPHARRLARPEQTDGSVSPQNGTGVTSLTTLLGEENKLQQSLQRPRSGHRDMSTRPRGGSGPSALTRLHQPRECVRDGQPTPSACVPSCEHRRQSFRVTSRLLSPHGAPAARRSHRSQRKTAVCPQVAGTHGVRGVAHGGLLAGAPQGTAPDRGAMCLPFPQRLEWPPVWTALFSAAVHRARQGGGVAVCLPLPPTVRAEG